jgi:tRNA pseudouridine38-40 synthase
MATHRLTLEYDGTDFHGWQSQPGARTVAGVVAEALQHVTGESPRLSAAGRTDAGAHAHGQVVGVTLNRDWDPARLQAALNANLPADVVVVQSAVRAAGFHARRDAVSRTYRYVAECRTDRAPVTRRHAWTVRGPLDVAAMRAAAEHLVGTHDFAAFGRPTAPGGSTVRSVHDIAVERTVVGDGGDGPAHDLVVITVRANAFLRGMMRAFAGALISVGQGRRAVTWVDDVLAARPAGQPAPPVAPAHGLHQWSVEYPWTPAVGDAA